MTIGTDTSRYEQHDHVASNDPSTRKRYYFFYQNSHFSPRSMDCNIGENV